MSSVITRAQLEVLHEVEPITKTFREVGCCGDRTWRGHHNIEAF